MKFSLIISFITTQLVFGRKVSIPLGMAGGMNFVLVLMLSFFLDLLFLPFVYFVYSAATSRIKFIKRMREFLIAKWEKKEHSRVFEWLKRLGKMGVVLAPAIPFTGGVNLSIPLADMLNLKLKQTLLLISFGNFLGCLLIALAAKGIITIFV
ncbi:MAG: small multi-drug export protein [Candidatus Omnitrophica bacterium]|nr:small multi-drug export protein [Candidatus Omnitrophota bacterium]